MVEDQTASYKALQPPGTRHCLRSHGDLANVRLQHPDVLFIYSFRSGRFRKSGSCWARCSWDQFCHGKISYQVFGIAALLTFVPDLGEHDVCRSTRPTPSSCSYGMGHGCRLAGGCRSLQLHSDRYQDACNHHYDGLHSRHRCSRVHHLVCVLRKFLSLDVRSAANYDSSMVSPWAIPRGCPQISSQWKFARWAQCGLHALAG